MAKMTRSTILFLLALAAGGFSRAEEAKTTVILNEDATNWVVSVYCGQRGVQAFVPGDKFRTSLSGMLVIDGKGNGYVAAGTFVAIVTSDGQADVLTGDPEAAGDTDGPPGRASFGNAIDIALANDGLLYVADAANFTLREIRRTGGAWVTTTVAGTPGVEGHRDGRGREALFCSVFDSVAVDADGAVYLFSGNWLRKFANGVVTTLNPEGGSGYRDGPLRQARFEHSQGRARALACDGKGNLYVADKVNAAIRKVELAKGLVTPVAGRRPDTPRDAPRDGPGADARFHPGGGPTTITYDRTHNRFVIHDDDDATIRVLSEGRNGWMVTSLGLRKELPDGVRPGRAAGVPCGIDAWGNVYLSRANHIQVLRKMKGND
jgi:hypothetical protein